MTIITATDFKKNLGKYLDSKDNEEIYITKNGKIIKKLSNTNSRLDILNNLVGALENNEIDYDELKYAYLKEKYNLWKPYSIQILF